MPIGPAPVTSTRDRPSTPAFRTAAMPTDSGSHSAAASSDIESGTAMREPRADRHVVAQRSVDGRSAEEPHVRAQVVVPASGFLAVGVGALRLDRDALADARPVHGFADADDRACGFVAEHQRCLDDEAAHAAVPVVVRVGSADAHRRHANEHVTGAGPGHRPLLHLDSSGFDEYGGPHSGRPARVLCTSHHHASVMSIYSHP